MRSCPLVQGFDEFMNLVVDEAAEVYVKDAKPRRELGTPSLVFLRPLPLTSLQAAFSSRVTTSLLFNKCYDSPRVKFPRTISCIAVYYIFVNT